MQFSDIKSIVFVDGGEEKAAESDNDYMIKKGMLVQWNSSGGTVYGRVTNVVTNGKVSAKPFGPSMIGSEENPAFEVQVWRSDSDGAWKKTDTITVHRMEALREIEKLPEMAEKTAFKAPQDVVADLPQERITGDVLRGYGPRRGNLERLLRYWRPIMRKPGGFRRCRVILANHPELYPLNNICAWLHHETTGLWPNEGCHHPGMKNCRRKLRGVVDGSIISNDQFENRLRRLGGKGMGMGMGDDVVTEDDMMHAMKVLRDFVDTEPRFVEILRDEDNWVHEGMDDDGMWTPHRWDKDKDCGCGCG